MTDSGCSVRWHCCSASSVDGKKDPVHNAGQRSQNAPDVERNILFALSPRPPVPSHSPVTPEDSGLNDEAAVCPASQAKCPVWSDMTGTRCLKVVERLVPTPAAQKAKFSFVMNVQGWTFSQHLGAQKSYRVLPTRVWTRGRPTPEQCRSVSGGLKVLQ